MRNREDDDAKSSVQEDGGEEEDEEIEEQEEKEEQSDQLTSLPSLHLLVGLSQSSVKLSSSQSADDYMMDAAEQQISTSSSCLSQQQQQQQQQTDEFEKSPTLAISSSSSNEQFNRLDQHRRSFSSPAVNLIPPSALLPAPAFTSPVGSASKRPAPAPPTEKLRRRTALGLISLGSTHFRLGGSSASGWSGKQSSSSSSSERPSSSHQQQHLGSGSNNGGIKEKAPTSSWRTWFSTTTSRSSSSLGVAAGTAGASGGSGSVGESAQSQPANNRSRTARKFLLRSLRPHTASVCSFTQVSAEQQQQQHQQVQREAVKQVTTESQSRLTYAQSPAQPRQPRWESNQDNHVQEHFEIQNSHPTSHSQQPVAAPPQASPLENTQLANKNILENLKSRALESSQTSSSQISSTDNQQAIESSNSSLTGTASSGKGSERSLQRQHQIGEICSFREQPVPSWSQYHQEETTNVAIATTCEQVGSLSSFSPSLPYLSASSSLQLSGEKNYPQMTSQHSKASQGIERMQPGGSFSLSISGAGENEPPLHGSTLVDRLVDSQLEWRQIIREANRNSDWVLERDLSELQIKRQEVIHELVQTERHHCLTLALMRQVYLSGLRKLNESRSCNGRTSSSDQPKSSMATLGGKSSGALSLPAALQLNSSTSSSSSAPSLEAANGDLVDLERLFPALEDLIAAHELFFAHLRLQLVESCQHKSRSSPVGLVGPIGDLLRDQFRLKMPRGDEQAPVVVAPLGSSQSNTGNTSSTSNQQQQRSTSASIGKIQQQKVPANGQKLLQAYAKFCGQHYDSSRYYKHLMQTDKGFKQFIEQCNKQNASCRQRGIPECNLLVTQRLTKYPLLIEQLIKTSKDEPNCEEEKLREALTECKSLLAELNNQLARKESFERLLDIYAHFCPKSYTIYNKQTRFTKHDLLQHKRLRQLIHSDGQIRVWSATRRKLFQVLCLILNDMVVFLQIESSHSSNFSSLSPNHCANVGGGGGGGTTAASTTCNHLAISEFGRAGPHPLPVDGGVSGDTPSSVSQLDLQHQLQQYLQPGVQCALLNAVAGALHTHTASPAHSTHSLLGLGGGVSSGNQPTSHSNISVAAAAAASGANHSHHGGGFGSVKYYFANIDNKSSVISLSKLLVREKAAHDGEPRIYLISSSPRQPEMYELAFMSKRHQLGFVEKLKGAIESHTKSLKEMLESGGDAHDLGMMGEYEDQYEDEYDVHEDEDDEEEEEEEDDDEEEYYNEEQLDEMDNNEELMMEFDERKCYCKSSTTAASHQRKSMLTRSQQQQQQQVAVASECKNNNSDLEDERDEQSEGDEEEFLTPKVRYRAKIPKGHRNSAQFEDAISASLSIEGKKQQVASKTELAALAPATGSSQNEKAKEGDEKCSSSSSSSSSSQLEPFELDIEQEVLLPPPQLEEDSSLINDEEETTNCCPSSDTDELSSILLKRSGSNESGGSGKHQAETSAESGLSERAKDSLDEAAPSRQKLRTGRRRRPQRPRNVSNQSSSSSEAAHRQAIELIAAQAASAKQLEQCETEEFDSGRGLDCSSSSSSSSSSDSHSSLQVTSSKKLPAQQRSPGQQQVAQLSKKIAAGKPDEQPVMEAAIRSASARGCQRPEVAPSGAPTSGHEASCDSSTVSTGSRSSRSGSCASKQGGAHHQRAVEECKSGSSSKLVKCSSILAKSGCSFMKQRKLSSVSTMSSQLKLINKLKSGLLEGGQFNGKCCSCLCLSHQQQYSACPSQHQSTLSKQVRQQMRRSSFLPEQKLEELRDLQIQLDKDKQEWQAKFDRMQEQLLNERRELDLAREKLKQDQQQVANEREQLYRKLDVLKEKGILLSPSHKVIITSPELRIYPPTLSQLDHHHHHSYHSYHQQQATSSARYGPLKGGSSSQHFGVGASSSITHIQAPPQLHHTRAAHTQVAANNSALNSHLQTTFYPDRTHPPHDNNYHFTGQRHFITQTGKVPMHLSENSNNATTPQQLGVKSITSSFNISSKVPLIGSPSSNSLLTDRFGAQSFSSSQNSASFKQQLESQLI